MGSEAAETLALKLGQCAVCSQQHAQPQVPRCRYRTLRAAPAAPAACACAQHARASACWCAFAHTRGRRRAGKPARRRLTGADAGPAADPAVHALILQRVPRRRTGDRGRVRDAVPRVRIGGCIHRERYVCPPSALPRAPRRSARPPARACSARHDMLTRTLAPLCRPSACTGVVASDLIAVATAAAASSGDTACGECSKSVAQVWCRKCQVALCRPCHSVCVPPPCVPPPLLPPARLFSGVATP